jgi:hypothetical protein
VYKRVLAEFVCTAQWVFSDHINRFVSGHGFT